MNDFNKRWRESGFDDSDLKKLKSELNKYPQSGILIYEKCQLRKASFVYKNKDKVGNASVIYAYFPKHKKIYLISICLENTAI